MEENETETITPSAEELKNESNTDRMLRERANKKNKNKQVAGAGAPAAGAASPADGGAAGPAAGGEGEKTPEQIEEERVAGLTPEQQELDRKDKEAKALEAKTNEGKTPEEIEKEKNTKASKEKRDKLRSENVNVEMHSLYKEEDDETPAGKKKDEKPGDEAAPEVKTKIALADEVSGDSFITGYLEVKRNGGNINDYLNTAKQRDYSKMTPEEIIAEDCRRKGITVQDDIDAEIVDFNAMSLRKQKTELEEITTSLTKQDEKTRTQLGLNLAESAKRDNTIVTKFKDEVVPFISNLIGKPIEGHKELTTKEAALLEKAVLNPKFTRPDGTFNTPYLVSTLARALFYEDDLRTAKADGFTIGFDKAMEDVTRPSRDGAGARNNGQQQTKTKAEGIRAGIGQAD